MTNPISKEECSDTHLLRHVIDERCWGPRLCTCYTFYVQTANSNMSLWPERLNDEAAENPTSKSEYYGRDSPITFMSTTQPPFELPPAHHRIVFDDIRGDIIVADQFDINWY
jgi:hypothetical protein